MFHAGLLAPSGGSSCKPCEVSHAANNLVFARLSCPLLHSLDFFRLESMSFPRLRVILFAKKVQWDPLHVLLSSHESASSWYLYCVANALFTMHTH